MNKLEPNNELSFISSLNLEITPELKKLAEETRVAIELLNYAVEQLPSANILIDTLAFQESKASSHIENIVTTNDDLYSGILFENYTAEAKEVANYKEALFKGFGAYQQKKIISLGDIEEINKPVNIKQHNIRKNLPNFASDLTRIANKKANGEVEIIYTPPHGAELIRKLLIDMLDFVYDDDKFDVHPLIKIALSHYQFEKIHPFRDGNGRTGRILNILFLCQKEYLNYPILYASSYIIKHKNEYYELLESTSETGDYNLIIKFMLSSFCETANKTRNIVESIKKLLSYYTADEFIQEIKGQKTVVSNLMEMIFKKVYVRISDLVELGVHRETASKLLKQLVDKGLLEQVELGRDKLFKNIKILELFE